MDEFERQFLLCLSDESTSVLSPLHGLSLVPGPLPVSGTRSSVDLQDLEDYKLERAVAAVLLHAGGIRDGDRVSWTLADRFIELEFATMGPDDDRWGGCNLRTHCLFVDLLRVWLTISKPCPATWLHNSACRMYSPASFVEQVALLQLRPALKSADSSVRTRAECAAGAYERLVQEFAA